MGVAQGPGITRASAFLHQQFGDVQAVEPIGSGEWSEAFSFRAGGRDLVVRFGQYPEDYEKDRVATRFAAPDLPIPEVLEIGDAFDGVYAVSERVYGRGFDGLDEAGYRRVLPAVFRALDALRRVDASGSSGYGIWRPDGSAPYGSWREMLLDVGNDEASERVRGWRPRLARHPASEKHFEQGLELLQGVVEVCPEERQVIHADLIGDNLLVRDDRVAGVVDWGNAMYGDFLYDVARLTFFLPWFPALARAGLEERIRERHASLPDFEARMRCYHLHLGLESMGYCAYTDRQEDMERSAERMLELGRP